MHIFGKNPKCYVELQKLAIIIETQKQSDHKECEDQVDQHVESCQENFVRIS